MAEHWDTYQAGPSNYDYTSWTQEQETQPPPPHTYPQSFAGQYEQAVDGAFGSGTAGIGIQEHNGLHSSSQVMTAPRNPQSDSTRSSDGIQSMRGSLSGPSHDGKPLLPDDNPSSRSTSLRRGMACTFCRKRKLKCTGDKPCTSCIKYNRDCEYSAPVKVAKIQALESRIAELSDYMSNSRNRPSGQQPEPGPQPIPYSVQGSISYADPTLAHDPSIPDHASYNADAYLDFSSHTFSTPDLTHDTGSSAPNTATFPIPPSTDSFQQLTTPMPLISGWEPQNGFSLFPQFQSQGGFGDPAIPPVLPQDFAAGVVPSQPFPDPPRVVQPPVPSTPGQANYLQHVLAATASATADLSKEARPIANKPSPRQVSTCGSSPSVCSTPDTQAPLNSTVAPGTPNAFGRPLPNYGMLHGTSSRILNTTHIDPIDGITESLGEFLFDPKNQDTEPKQDVPGSAAAIKRRKNTGDSSRPRSKSLIAVESDGLTTSAREIMLDCFLAHSRLFFEMSIPRFRYRMSFTDKRRPAPALLYSMYLWATRMSHSPKASPMEPHFFEIACKALDISSANGDRLLDCMKAAMLLSAYAYTCGRYHEGWILTGLAVRLVKSTGVHQIKSCVFSQEPPRDPFLRNKAYLLSPPEDATELAERMGTFWSVVAMDRCSALATGFSMDLRDADITTPFPRPFADIISRAVTLQDDITVRDLYRPSYMSPNEDYPLARWMKTTIVLERASKLAFLDPDETSDYARAWSAYYMNVGAQPQLMPPPAWLDQPRYRSPKDYSEVKLALSQLISNMGADGVFPVERRHQAEADGAEDPMITPHTIMIHHQFAAIEMLVHDVNSPGANNTDAVNGARKAVALIRHMPPLPHHDVDTFCVTVWSIIIKVLIKEMRSQHIKGNMPGMKSIEEDVDLFINELQRVGAMMQLARTQAKAMIGLKAQALLSASKEPSPSDDPTAEYPHLQNGIRV